MITKMTYTLPIERKRMLTGKIQKDPENGLPTKRKRIQTGRIQTGRIQKDPENGHPQLHLSRLLHGSLLPQQLRNHARSVIGVRGNLTNPVEVPLKGGAGNVRLATRSVLSVSAKAALTKMNKFD